MARDVPTMDHDFCGLSWASLLIREGGRWNGSTERTVRAVKRSGIMLREEKEECLKQDVSHGDGTFWNALFTHVTSGSVWSQRSELEPPHWLDTRKKFLAKWNCLGLLWKCLVPNCPSHVFFFGNLLFTFKGPTQRPPTLRSLCLLPKVSSLFLFAH